MQFNSGCGLMQKAKDIQRMRSLLFGGQGCGLMQKAKDIQLDIKIKI